MTERTKDAEGAKIERSARAKVSAQDALKKMREFGKRREQFVAAVREGKG